MTYLQAAILGVVQGLTEFLPVSSSGHLALVRIAMGKEACEGGLSFAIALHGATLAVILVSFRREIASLLGENRRLVPLLVLGTVPAGVAGLLARDAFGAIGENAFAVGAALFFNALLLFGGELFGMERKPLGALSASDALLVGVAQAAALTPGVSRSGSTIVAGFLCGLRREAAVRFSFLLAIPAIGGAVTLDAIESSRAGADAAALGAGKVAVGCIAAFCTGMIAVPFLIGAAKARKFKLFGLWCLAAAACAIALGFLAPEGG